MYVFWSESSNENVLRERTGKNKIRHVFEEQCLLFRNLSSWKRIGNCRRPQTQIWWETGCWWQHGNKISVPGNCSDECGIDLVLQGNQFYTQ